MDTLTPFEQALLILPDEYLQAEYRKLNRKKFSLFGTLGLVAFIAPLVLGAILRFFTSDRVAELISGMVFAILFECALASYAIFSAKQSAILDCQLEKLPAEGAIVQLHKLRKPYTAFIRLTAPAFCIVTFTLYFCTSITLFIYNLQPLMALINIAFFLLVVAYAIVAVNAYLAYRKHAQPFEQQLMTPTNQD